MANQYADGSIIVDTQIDRNGFDAGSAEMQKAIKSLIGQIDGLGPTFYKALNGSGSAADAFSAKSAALNDKIQELEASMQNLANTEVDNPEYAKLTTDIEKAEKELHSAKAGVDTFNAALRATDEFKEFTELKSSIDRTEDAFNRTVTAAAKLKNSKGPDSKEYVEAFQECTRLKEKLEQLKTEKDILSNSQWAQSTQQEYAQVESVLQDAQANYDALLNKKRELEANGQQIISGATTTAYADLAGQLDRAKGKLADMTSEADNFEIASEAGAKQVSRGAKFATGLKAAMSKIGSVVKGGLSKGVSAFASKLKGAHKTADGLHKKLLKMGFAMLGMRGVMGGIRQLVSSALSNNEQLQNQLSAAKGVLGQALTPIITFLVNALATAVTFADRLYQIFSGVSLISKYNAKQSASTSNSLGSAAKNANKLKRQLAGFDELNVLSDSSNDGSGGGGTAATFDPASMSKEMQDFIDQFKKLWENGDFYGIGSLISSKIVGALQGVDWENIKKKTFSGGKSFAELLNGLFEYSDSDGNTLMSSIGKTIGESFNTLLSVVNGFAANLHWNNLGSELANGISTAITTIDWKLLFKTAINLGKGFGSYINGLFEYKDADGNGLATNLATGLSNAVHAALKAVIAFVKTVNWQSIGTSIADFLQGINWVQLFSDLGRLLSEALKGALDLVIGFLEGMDWGKAVQDYQNLLIGFWISIDWTALAEKISRLVGDLIGAIFSIVAQTFIQIVRGVFNLGQLIKDYFGKYIKDAKDSGGSIVDGIKQGIVDGLKQIGTWIKEHIFEPFINGFKNTFGIHSPSTVMAEMGGYIVDGLKNGIGNIWNKLSEKFTAFWTSVSTWFSNKWQSFTNLGSNIVNKIKSGIGGIWSKLCEKFTAFWSSLSSWFSNKWNSFVNLGSTAISKIKSGIGGIWSKISSNFSSMWSSISAWFSNKWQSFTNLGGNIIKGIKTGINNKIGEIKTALTSGLNSALTSVKKLLGIHSPSRVFRDEVGQYIGLGISEGISESVPEVVGNVATLSKAIGNEIDNNEYAINPIGVNGADKLTAGMEAFADIIASGFTTLIDRLQAIANSVAFVMPAAANIAPYGQGGAGDSLKDFIHDANEDLISVLIQLFQNQNTELQRLYDLINSLDLTIDEKAEANRVIAEINRRTRVLGGTPILL